jgi:hypothetical protein
MDANVNRFMRDPEFQRLAQRYARQRPEQRALLDVAALTPGFADGYQRQLVSALQAGAQKEQFGDRMENRRQVQQTAADQFGQNFAMRQQQADRGFGLEQDAMDWNRTQSRWALPLNVGSVLANTYAAGKVYDASAQQAAEERAYRERIMKYLGG